MRMHCLLISSPKIGRLFPRGLMEIASFLESKGWPVTVMPLAHYLDSSGLMIDREDNLDEISSHLERALERAAASVVGVSNQFTYDYPYCLKVLEICKKINKNIITVIGGPHVTFQDLACIESPFVDVVVRGEGEWTMLDLLSTIERRKDLGSVKGITFKKKGKVLRTAQRPLGDLSKFPPINFELAPYEFIRHSAIYGMLNRGCLYNCSFCVEKAFWKKRRSFPVKRLIDEMKTLELRYKNQIVALEDSMLYMGSEQFSGLCSGLIEEKIKLPVNFYIQSRVDTVTEEGIRILRKTNIRHVWLGIESASPKVLKMMNKNITINEAITACEKLQNDNFKTSCFWIIGHPGDDAKEAAYSLEMFKYLFTKGLIVNAAVSLFVPYPGTKFFHQPQRYGVEILSFVWQKWQMQSNEPICQLGNFSAGQIKSFLQKSRDVVRTHKCLQSYLDNTRYLPTFGEGVNKLEVRKRC